MINLKNLQNNLEEKFKKLEDYANELEEKSMKNLEEEAMTLEIRTSEIMSEARYPFRTPDPTDTVRTIIEGLVEVERQIDSPQVEAEIALLSTGGVFFDRNKRPCLNIKLRETKTKDLKKFGCCIVPQEFGNLVYLVQYEYMSMGIFDEVVGKEKVLSRLKKQLTTLDEWMEYTFIQTLGDYIFVEILQKYDPNFSGNLDAYRTFFDID